MIGEVEVVVAAEAELGEGPVWDVRVNRLAWIDILGKAIHLTDPHNGETETIPVPLHVGAIAPRTDGGYVAALQDGFWVIGDGPARRIAEISGMDAHLRFNDGKCDPSGRFWAGTMAYAKTPGAASLYRLDIDGTVTRVLDKVTISNGLAWSQDSTTMFYIDSPTQSIAAFRYESSTGSISDRRSLVDIPVSAGSPDGMTMDTEGGIWVALWGGSAVHRYLHGRLDRIVDMPVSQPTSCSFGGPGLDELYVTSAWSGLTSQQRAAQPLAGALFRVRVDVVGLPPFAYGPR